MTPTVPSAAGPGGSGPGQDQALVRDLIAQSLSAPAESARIGRHDVLRETLRIPRGDVTSVYQIQDGRVVVVRARDGSYRDDVAAALLDAADEVAGADSLGAAVHVRPISVTGFPLDRAVVLGPAASRCFAGTPALAARSVRVLPAHRSEVIDGEDSAQFWYVMSSMCLGAIDGLWARQPNPRAAMLLLDDWPGGPLVRTARPVPIAAETLMGSYLPGVPRGVRALVRDVRGYELVLHREWDQLTGTLTAPQQPAGTSVAVGRQRAWEAFAPLFRGADPDLGALTAGGGAREADLLEMTYSSRDRGYASLPVPAALDECLDRIRIHLTRDPGNLASFNGRSGAIVQLVHEGGGRLWLEAPDPAARLARGRHVSVTEAERMLTVLAREDRSAVSELGNLEILRY